MRKPATASGANKQRHAPARRNFVRDEGGTTAIEFALLGVPFFAIIGAIIETSLVFFAGQVLDSAVHDSARLIRTGQAQTAGYNLANFRTAICDGLYGLFDCSQLRINVSVVNTFSSATVTVPVSPSCTSSSCAWTLNEAYAAGSGSDIILVQAYYKWPTIIQFGGFNLQNLGDGSRLLAGIRVFQNEPFTTS